MYAHSCPPQTQNSPITTHPPHHHHHKNHHHHTGFDNAAFRSVAKTLTGTAEAGARMRAIPELMYFIDKDPTVSAFFRNRAWSDLELGVCVCVSVSDSIDNPRPWLCAYIYLHVITHTTSPPPHKKYHSRHPRGDCGDGQAGAGGGAEVSPSLLCVHPVQPVERGEERGRERRGGK